MKKVTALVIGGMAIVTACMSIGQVFGQTSASTLSTLTSAQAAERQAQLAQNIQIIMPPPIPAATLAKIQAKKAAMARMHPMGGPLEPSPMDSQQSGPPMYQVIDLGTLTGGNQSSANAINNAGQVVGESTTTGGFNHAFLWQNTSVIQDLGVLGTHSGVAFSSANGINSKGQITGSSSTSSGNADAFLWHNGTMQGLVIGGNESSGQGINSTTQIVGSYGTIVSDPGFLWQNGTSQSLGTLGGSDSEAWAINDAGQIVGDSQTSAAQDHAFLWQSGTMQDLGTLGGTFSAAYAINSSGDIAGASMTSSFLFHAFLRRYGSMQDLGTLGGDNGTAYSVNSSDQVVGYDNTSVGNQDAFLWQNGTMYDLNNLLFTDYSGWIIEEANGINDVGQIVGFGITSDGYQHAFLLNPFITLTYTGYPQFSTDLSVVPAEFGMTVPDKDKGAGSGANYVGGLAKTASYGCALCSLAAMLTTIPGFETTTPVTLDPQLVANGGYTEGCEMTWTPIGVITGGKLGRVDSESWPNYSVTATAADQSALDQFLDDHCWGNRYRVILQLEENGIQGNTHYIFVVGKTNDDWIVFDPGWGNAFNLGGSGPAHPEFLSSLNAHLNGFNSKDADRVFTVTGVETYQLNPPNGSLSQVVHSPVELLVTDPNGNQVGYDPTTGNDVFQIPGASYTRDYPILDADQGLGSVGDTNGIKIVSIPAPLGGTYTTALIGTDSGSYTFDTSIVWSGNIETNETVTGTTDIGVITTNSVFVITPPVITSSSASGGNFNLWFTSQTNVTYAVQGVNSLLSTNWTSVTTVTATGTNTTASVPMTDPNMMFYRVVSQ